MVRFSPSKKRQRTSASSSPAPPVHDDASQSSRSVVCTFTKALFPVRFCLHALLTEEDAARLLRVGRSVAVALLSCFTFHHPFRPASVEAMLCTLALYERYELRVARMCLPFFMRELELGSGGRSPLPSTLTSLVLGCVEQPRESLGRWTGDSMFDSPSPCSPPVLSHCSVSADDSAEDIDLQMTAPPWRVFAYRAAVGDQGASKEPLPAGLVPHGVRQLQLGVNLNRPLAKGLLPPSLAFLQVGSSFDQPLDRGVLPPLLTHLVLSNAFTQQLAPGDLPATLEQLDLGVYRWPLAAGVLPAGLHGLELGLFDRRPLLPGVLPSSLKCLRFNPSFDTPLMAGALPQGLRHLNLGRAFNHRLLRSVLPSSLEELIVSAHFDVDIAEGELPEGLRVLRFAFKPPANLFGIPNVLPQGLVALDLGVRFGRVIGRLPDGLRWLKVPQRTPFRSHVDLPPRCQIAYHDTVYEEER